MCSTTIFSAHTDAVSCARQLFLMPAVQLRSIHSATSSRKVWTRDQGNDHASPRGPQAAARTHARGAIGRPILLPGSGAAVMGRSGFR